MKKHLFLLLSVCSLFTKMTAEEVKKALVQFEVTQGLRRDHFKAHAHLKNWPIDVKGSASLKNVRIYETRLKAQVNMGNYFLRLNGGYGKVLKSNAKFSVFGFKATHPITGGKALDAKASFGRECFFTEHTSISPLFGYLWGEEKIDFGKISYPKKFKPIVKYLRDSKGIDIDKITHPKWRWQAPFVGLGFKTKPGKDWVMYGEYNFACVPLKRVKGYGHIGTVGIGYDITQRIALNIEYEHSHLRAHYVSNRIRAHGAFISSMVRLGLHFSF